MNTRQEDAQAAQRGHLSARIDGWLGRLTRRDQGSSIHVSEMSEVMQGPSGSAALDTVRVDELATDLVRPGMQCIAQ